MTKEECFYKQEDCTFLNFIEVENYLVSQGSISARHVDRLMTDMLGESFRNDSFCRVRRNWLDEGSEIGMFDLICNTFDIPLNNTLVFWVSW